MVNMECVVHSSLGISLGHPKAQAQAAPMENELTCALTASLACWLTASLETSGGSRSLLQSFWLLQSFSGSCSLLGNFWWLTSVWRKRQSNFGDGKPCLQSMNPLCQFFILCFDFFHVCPHGGHLSGFSCHSGLFRF